MKQMIMVAVVSFAVGAVGTPLLFKLSKPSTVEKEVKKATFQGEVAALVPFCVANADDEELIAKIKATTSAYSRRELVKEAGWAMLPEGAKSTLVNEVNEECGTAIRAKN